MVDCAWRLRTHVLGQGAWIFCFGHPPSSLSLPKEKRVRIVKRVRFPDVFGLDSLPRDLRRIAGPPNKPKPPTQQMLVRK